MAKIFVTRPDPGLRETIQKLRGSHHQEVFAAPALEITEERPLRPFPARMILLSSMHALAALQAQDRECHILAVGEKTAERARNMGFRTVSAAGGNAEKLIALFHQKGGVPSETWLAAGCGNDGKLYGDSIVKALQIQRFKAYQTRWKKAFSEEVVNHLYSEGEKQFLFYSSETVRAFMAILKQTEQSLRKKIDWREVEGVCMSPAIATILTDATNGLGIRNIQIGFEGIF